MAVKVETKNNSAAMQSQLMAAIGRGLDGIGQSAVRHAQETVPVRTGRLRDSIDYDRDDTSVVISANTDYAAYVEMGTSKQAARPYLRPTLTNYTDVYRSYITTNIMDVL